MYSPFYRFQKPYYQPYVSLPVQVNCSSALRVQLKDFLDQFLAGPYNKLMGQVVQDMAMERSRGLSEPEEQLR